MINIERKLGKIVAPFDQKDGHYLGEWQPKTYGVRTQLTSPPMAQKVGIKNNAKKHVEKSLLSAIGKTSLNVGPRWPGAVRNHFKQTAQAIVEIVSLDDEKLIAIGFDQSQFAKSLHEQADRWPRRADHLREFFIEKLARCEDCATLSCPWLGPTLTVSGPVVYWKKAVYLYSEERNFNDRKLITFSALHRSSLFLES